MTVTVPMVRRAPLIQSAKPQPTVSTASVPNVAHAAPSMESEGMSRAFDFACKMLAQPYADHPDFSEEWKL